MVNTEILPISKLRVNSGQIARLPKNPRLIRDERFEKLKQSIKNLPSMLDIRELVCVPFKDAFIVIAGNMRLRAAKELGLKELPCKILPADTPVEQLAEISIKDNVAFGADDFDILANEWTDFPLEEWGMEIPGINDPADEWIGMPEYENEDKTAFQSIHLHFKDQEAIDKFAALIGQTITAKTRYLWFPHIEIERYADKEYA